MMESDEFRQARYDLDMSARELASEIGVHLRTVYRWESGETKVTGPAATSVRLMLYIQELGAPPPSLAHRL